MRSGYVTLLHGDLRYAGGDSDNWSGSAHEDQTFAYRLYAYGQGGVLPLHYLDRYLAFSVKLNKQTISFLLLFYVRSGRIEMVESALWYVGFDTYNWSGVTQFENHRVYYFGFNNADVQTFADTDYGYAFPVRKMS